MTKATTPPDGTKFRGVGNEQRLVVSSVGPGTQLVLNDRPGIVNAGSTTFVNDMLLNRSYRFGCRLRITSADGTSQSVPVDPYCVILSASVGITALDVTRVAATPTIVTVLIGKKS